jgi:hypothetical protein
MQYFSSIGYSTNYISEAGVTVSTWNGLAKLRVDF